PLPKGDPPLDVLRVGLCLRVIPRGIAVHVAVHDHVVIARRSFPRTYTVRFARLKIFRLERFGREVMVSLDHLCIVAFGQNGPVPNCFHIVPPLLTQNPCPYLRRGHHTRVLPSEHFVSILREQPVKRVPYRPRHRDERVCP